MSIPPPGAVCRMHESRQAEAPGVVWVLPTGIHILGPFVLEHFLGALQSSYLSASAGIPLYDLNFRPRFTSGVFFFAAEAAQTTRWLQYSGRISQEAYNR
jgi:hypothetical protein